MTTNTNIVGQYASDHALHAGDPALRVDPHGVKAMRGDGNGAMHHDIVLFDHASGTLDETTGQIIREPDEVIQKYSGEDMRIVDDRHLQLGRRALVDKADPADEWMRVHGHKW